MSTRTKKPTTAEAILMVAEAIRELKDGKASHDDLENFKLELDTVLAELRQSIDDNSFHNISTEAFVDKYRQAKHLIDAQERTEYYNKVFRSMQQEVNSVLRDELNYIIATQQSSTGEWRVSDRLLDFNQADNYEGIQLYLDETPISSDMNLTKPRYTLYAVAGTGEKHKLSTVYLGKDSVLRGVEFPVYRNTTARLLSTTNPLNLLATPLQDNGWTTTDSRAVWHEDGIKLASEVVQLTSPSISLQQGEYKLFIVAKKDSADTFGRFTTSIGNRVINMVASDEGYVNEIAISMLTSDNLSFSLSNYSPVTIDKIVLIRADEDGSTTKDLREPHAVTLGFSM